MNDGFNMLHGLADRSEDAALRLRARFPHRYSPAPSHNYVIQRERVLRAMTEASLSRQLTILQSGPGTGKSTLLAQWAAQLGGMGRRSIWLTLEPCDGSPRALTAALADAALAAGLGELSQAIEFAVGDIHVSGPEAAGRIVAGAFNETGLATVLILDGYEACDTPDLGTFIAALAHHATRLHIALASRRRTWLPLSSLRARNLLFEVSSTQLNFTPFETKAVMGDLLPELYAHHLHAKTDGIPVAIQFARRALEESRPFSESGCWQEWTDEYFRSEVLGRLDDELKEIVSRLVIVDRFDLSLAQALTDSGIGAVIEKLYRVEGILLHDVNSGEYHFPEMLRSFLSERLLTLDSCVRAELHGRAADWFAQRGLFAEALEHAISADNKESSLDLLERIGGNPMIMHKGVVGARGLLNAVTLDEREAEPIAHPAFAMILAHEGRIKEAAEVVAAAREHLGAGALASSSQHRQLVLIDSFISGFRDEPANAERMREIEEVLESCEPGEHDERAQAYTLLSWQHYLRGDLVLAGQELDRAAAEYAGSDGIYGSIFIHVHRALLAYWQGDLDWALDESRLAGRLADLFFPGEQRLRILTQILRGAISFELGSLPSDLQFVELVGLASGMESWTEIQLWAHSFGIRSASWLGKMVEAHAIHANGLDVAVRLKAPRLDWTLRCLGMMMAETKDDRAGLVAEMNDLGLSDGSYLERPELGWQERIGGALMAGEIWAGLGEKEKAAGALAIARQELDSVSIPRFEAAYQLACARLQSGSALSGDEAPPSYSTSPERRLDYPLFVQPKDGAVPGHRAVERSAGRAENPLTLREQQILEYIEEGHPSKVAAYRFGLSEATIKFHLRNIYRKLKAQNRTQALARYRALRNPTAFS